ncbi:hypothetical protein ACXGQW_06030 [Wenyingzhuangia sp. IMCC45533]
MKKAHLLLFIIFNFSFGTPPNEITIGGEDESLAVPIRTSNNYSYSQIIYNQSDINMTGDITHIKYYLYPTFGSPEAYTNSDEWTIYLAHTSKVQFSDLDDNITNLTEVFSGKIFVDNSEILITFDSPFKYNGIDNLVVSVHENKPNNESSDGISFLGSIPSQNISLTYYSDIHNPNPLEDNLNSNYSGQKGFWKTLPKTTFTINEEMLLSVSENEEIENLKIRLDNYKLVTNILNVNLEIFNTLGGKINNQNLQEGLYFIRAKFENKPDAFFKFYVSN